MPAHPAYIKIGEPSRRQKKNVSRARKKMELCSEDTRDFKKKENDTEVKAWTRSKGNGLSDTMC